VICNVLTVLHSCEEYIGDSLQNLLLTPALAVTEFITYTSTCCLVWICL